MNDGNHFKAILNHLSGTGIYVIHRESHQLLYFNDRVKEVTPGIELGYVCHEVWEGYCENCPLNEIGERESCTTISYDDPFGDAVDIMATRMMWEETIPAYLISITQHIQDEHEKKLVKEMKHTAQQRKNLERVCNFVCSRDYEILTTFDVEQSRYEVNFSRAGGPYANMERQGGIADWIYQMVPSDLVHPEELELMTKKCHMDYIRIELETKPEVSLYYRMLCPGSTFHWFSLAFSYSDPENMRMIGAARDIQNIQDMQLKEEIATQSMNVAMTQIYDEILYVNLSRNRIEFIKSRGTYERVENRDWEQDIVAFIHPSDRDIYQNLMSREHLIQAFESGKTTVKLECRRKGSDGGYHWIVKSVVHVEDNLEGDKMAMVFVSTVDREKQLVQVKEEFYNGMSVFFGESLMINITKGIYQIRKCDKTWEGLPEHGDYLQMTNLYAEKLIHPEDREQFCRKFHLNSFRKALSSGEKKIVCELRRKVLDGSYHWVELAVVPIPNRFDDDKKAIGTCRDIHELKSMQKEQVITNQKFIQAVRSLYDIILEGDLNTNQIYDWKVENSGARRILSRHTLEERFALAADEIIHPDYREEYLKLLGVTVLKQAFERGQNRVYLEAPRKTEDGSYRWHSMEAQLISIEGGLGYMMFYLKDLDEAKKEEERKRMELMDALSLAERANRAKTEFLSRMSHDIRTPMNAIIGMNQIALVNRNEPEKIQDCLNKIDISAKFLLSLINDILDMSRIESGKMQLLMKPFFLGDLLDQVATVIELQAEEKQQQFTVSLQNGVDGEYVGDTLRLNQILTNLLNNAVKYTNNHGSISMEVSGRARPDGMWQLVFVIEDNGIGMTQEFLQRLYDPFEQEHEIGGRIMEGSGLGLSITSNLVQNMNGQMVVESQAGAGSRFQVELPIQRIGERRLTEKLKERGQAEELYNMTRGLLLLVEDNAINLEIACTLLEMEGFQIDTACNGEEAVKKFEISEIGMYQAILMDIRMPVMDGLEATKCIRHMNRSDAASVPIIAMTANAFQDEMEYAKCIGMSGYLIKPVETKVMMEMIYNHIHRR